MARTRKAWIDAREAAGMTQRDVDYWFHENHPDLGIDQPKLSRFEQGGSAKVSEVALAVLANRYGKRLEDIDPAAANAYNRLRELVILTTGCKSVLAERAA